MKKILFAICGIGLGNASRCSAIIEELNNEFDVRIAIFANAYNLFKDRYKIYKLYELNYPKLNKINVFKTFFLKDNVFNFIKNVLIYFKILQDFKPDIVVVDSDYACLIPCKIKRIPIIGINNSFTVKKAWKEYKSKIFKSCLFSYYILEQIDYLCMKLFHNLVICPAFKKYETKIRKIIQVNPIVRKRCQIPNSIGKRLAPTEDIVLIMCGGSDIEMDYSGLNKIKKQVIIIGKKNKNTKGHLYYKGIVKNSLDYLEEAKYIVIQGGLSSISEITNLKKPCIVIPIRGHAEQNLNAIAFEELGLGVLANSQQEDIALKLDELMNNYDTYKSKFNTLNIKCDGAFQTAREIRSFLKRR